VGAQIAGKSLIAVAAGVNITASYTRCIKWKEVKGALAKRTTEDVRKSSASNHTAATRDLRLGPSAKQNDLGEGWNHVVQKGRVV
jgi:hypothetical protein